MIALYMLDTNTVSYIIKRASTQLDAKLRALGPDDTVVMSSITEAEVLFGFAKTPQSPSRRQYFADILQRTAVLSWGSAEAAIYASLRARLQASGTPISPLDTLIAAHALAVNATLVTSDKAFRLASGLRIANWATDIST